MMKPKEPENEIVRDDTGFEAFLVFLVVALTLLLSIPISTHFSKPRTHVETRDAKP